MFADRNKTELTKDVTDSAMNYLSERGCKPYETEVPICAGWVADIAGVFNPTVTELRALKLIPAGMSWALARQYQQLMTVLVEVKTSRSDFMGDKKWTASPQANLMYVAIPKELAVSKAELPAGWGVLEYSEATGCRIAAVPIVHQIPMAQQLTVILEVATRQHNNVAYEEMRERLRAQRVRESENVSRTRVMDAMRAMSDIAHGKNQSVEIALALRGIKNLDQFLLEEINSLWNVANKNLAAALAAEGGK